MVAQRVMNAYQRGDAGDTGLIPGSGRSHGGGNGNPLQYSCLESPTDRGAWWATVHGVAESQTRLVITHTYTEENEESRCILLEISCFIEESCRMKREEKERKCLLNFLHILLCLLLVASTNYL